MGFAIGFALAAVCILAGAAVMACCIISGIVDRDTFPTKLGD